MVIKIDKDAEKLLTEILDVYAKATGLRGIQNVNKVMSSVSLLREEEGKKEEDKGSDKPTTTKKLEPVK